MMKSVESNEHRNEHRNDHHEGHIEGQAEEQTEGQAETNKYWQSLEQYFGDPDFIASVKQEFQSTPLRENHGTSLSLSEKSTDLSENSAKSKTDLDFEKQSARRTFLKLMGASMALATTNCVRRPVQKIVPYNKQPEEVTYEVPNIYTSVQWDGQEPIGLLVKTREGRPIKLEGNSAHPYNQGALNSRVQAHLLSLYEPERLKEPPKAWELWDKEFVAHLEKGSVYWLGPRNTSPSFGALLEDFSKTFQVQMVHWQILDHQELREGQKISYGETTVPAYRFDRAKIIVSIDADFLGTWLHPVQQIRQFAKGRKNLAKMNRLISLDSNYSLTGANADIRFKIKPSQQWMVALAIAHDLIYKHKVPALVNLSSELEQILKNSAEKIQKLKWDLGAWNQMLEDLVANKGSGLVIAGGPPTQTNQALPLQICVNWINSMLGNEGQTILDQSVWKDSSRSSVQDLFNLVDKMKKGQVQTLIIHRCNPVYCLPPSVGFEEALSKVPHVVYIGDLHNETSLKAQAVLPEDHDMESWGDFETDSGYYSIQQPTIRPLYNTRSAAQDLIQWISLKTVQPSSPLPQNRYSASTYYDYVRAHTQKEFSSSIKGTFESFWYNLLQEGGVQRTQRELPKTRPFNALALVNFPTTFHEISKSGDSEGMELVIAPSAFFREGSLNHSAWLQELPDPVTKIVWDNCASISIQKAKTLQVEEGDLVRLQVHGVPLEVPIHIQPGLHDDVVSVTLGYGRTAAGKVGSGVGFTVYPWVQASPNGWVFSGQKLSLEKTGKKYKLACVQGHHSMEGRKIVAEATLDEYLKNPAANNHRHKVWSLWPGHAYNGQKWAMAVDLTACVGCNACMTACQAENNVPVVGKNYVLEGREMHWLRIDRYYVGNPENAESVFQPVMCQQCDNAPCETVCPVLATVHSNEGLNDMVYNRCVGTRYCSNNCPYKVRRFNWFDYYGEIKKPLTLAYNPDVTVRMRGVMEKCTFCVQRIKTARRKARLEQRDVNDGEIQTACQQSCPADALTFGNVNDPNSRVAKLFKDARAYGLLEEFNAAPSVQYLTKIRNSKG